MKAGKKRRCPEPCLPYVATSEEHFTGLRQMAREKKERNGGQDAGACSDHVASWGGHLTQGMEMFMHLGQFQSSC